MAIPLPGKVIEALRDIGKPMPGVSWTDPDQCHLTLRFIGEVSPSKKATIEKELSKVNEKQFYFGMDGFGFFPNRQRPRVFWAAVESEPVLYQLQEKVERACQRAGIEAETRAFVPHITLARIKQWPDEMDAMLQKHDNFGMESIPVRQFNLYESRLSNHRTEHLVVKSFKLE